MSERAQNQLKQSGDTSVAPGSNGMLQRKCACGNHTMAGGECAECDKKGGMLQRKAMEQAGVSEAPQIAREVLNSPGKPLDAQTRAFFEPRFGRDFSNVRIHTDTKAAESAQAVAAAAYTAGNNMVFGQGQYSFGTSRGKQLLAHELSHIVQQRGQAEMPTGNLEVGPANDVFEREADRTSQEVMSENAITQPVLTSPGDSSVRISRSFLSDLFTRPFTAIARLFGSENYSREELQAYLDKLKETNKIEDNYDSDNKARAIVHRRGEFPALSLDIRVLLIREMLSGATLGADEAAILELLKTATADERRQMINRIGRDRLWGDFSGANRRAVEAVTLTAGDFNDKGLVDRLRSLSREELTEYRDQAMDPEVRTNIVRILAMQNITTPLDITTNFTPSGAATLTINGFEVTVLPDEHNAGDIPVNKAFTNVCMVSNTRDAAGIPLNKPIAEICSMRRSLAQNVMASQATNQIASFTPPTPGAVIQTRYGRIEEGTGQRGGAGYGRGTTAEDISAGNTSLRFHESRHGADILEHLSRHPAPVFSGQVGMSLEQFRMAEDTYSQDITDYSKRVSRFTVERTDCPGTPIPPQDLQKLGLPATLCTDLERRR